MTAMTAMPVGLLHEPWGYLEIEIELCSQPGLGCQWARQYIKPQRLTKSKVSMAIHFLYPSTILLQNTSYHGLDPSVEPRSPGTREKREQLVTACVRRTSYAEQRERGGTDNHDERRGHPNTDLDTGAVVGQRPQLRSACQHHNMVSPHHIVPQRSGAGGDEVSGCKTSICGRHDDYVCTCTSTAASYS